MKKGESIIFRSFVADLWYQGDMILIIIVFIGLTAFILTWSTIILKLLKYFLKKMPYEHKHLTFLTIIFGILFFTMFGLIPGTIMLCQIPVEEAIRFSSDYGIADVKKMDFDIYINEDGSVKVKQLIEVSSNEHEIPVNLFDMDNYFFHLSRTEEEEIEEKMDLKIVDVVTRKSFDRI